MHSTQLITKLELAFILQEVTKRQIGLTILLLLQVRVVLNDLFWQQNNK